MRAALKEALSQFARVRRGSCNVDVPCGNVETRASPRGPCLLFLATWTPPPEEALTCNGGISARVRVPPSMWTPHLGRCCWGGRVGVVWRRSFQRGRPSGGRGCALGAYAFLRAFVLQYGRPARGVAALLMIASFALLAFLQCGRLLRRRCCRGNRTTNRDSGLPSTWTSLARTLLPSSSAGSTQRTSPSTWTSPAETLLPGNVGGHEVRERPSTWTPLVGTLLRPTCGTTTTTGRTFNVDAPERGVGTCTKCHVNRLVTHLQRGRLLWRR
ncbi:hypothetical protein F4561_002199 [Lipingzhangella halophila]|uniref:Uncharacterized protein n=1 Tax=Lipingzhangella halophila TaxID=1783352 RepID=A0A7W7W328_9ACTN|nr:hypothetical protein [Lipingzhangella halophila]